MGSSGSTCPDALLPPDIRHPQPLDLSPLPQHRGLQDLLDVPHGYPAVPQVVRPHGYRDPLAAVLEAAGADHHDLIPNPELLHPVLEAVVDLHGAAGAAARLGAFGRALVRADEDLDLRLGHARDDSG